jgi:hypothetical protein
MPSDVPSPPPPEPVSPHTAESQPDFNDLLTVILGYSELLLRGLPAEQLIPAAEQIHAAAKRALALIRGDSSVTTAGRG